MTGEGITQMKQRISYIDSAKALLIALVVVGHILQYANPHYEILPYILAQEFIYVFHMPAFFLLSGMLSDAETWKGRSFSNLLKSRLRTLIIPYAFFELLAVVYKHFVLKSVSIKEGLYLMLTLRSNVGGDWYLPALFMASLIYWLYVRLPWKHGGGILALAAGFVIPCILPEGHVRNLVFRALLGFGFMVVGALLRKQLTSFDLRKGIAAFLLTAVSAAASLKFGLGNDFFSCTLKCPPLFLIGGVCGLYFVLGLARLMDCKQLAYIGQNSLVIMGTHQLVLYTIKGSSSPLWVMGVFILIVAVELGVVYLTNQFCPELIGKRRKVISNE